jgi:hypothetical protein
MSYFSHQYLLRHLARFHSTDNANYNSSPLYSHVASVLGGFTSLASPGCAYAYARTRPGHAYMAHAAGFPTQRGTITSTCYNTGSRSSCIFGRSLAAGFAVF